MVVKRSNITNSSEELREFKLRLVIDRDDLDTCLVEQPEAFWHVAERLVRATADRDLAKLELEEKGAELDQQLRRRASDKRVTEGALQNQLRSLPAYQAAQRKYLEAMQEAGQFAALKEAFQQRSFMLRELVSKTIAERHDLGMAGGSGQARRDLQDVAVDDARRKMGEARRMRAKGKT